MDQVLSYIESCLKDYIKVEVNEKIITKTMINNYVKQNIIQPPVNKKYNRLHIAELFVICILKQVYSISEVKALINLALEANSAENSYNRFCDYLTESLISTFNGTEYSEISTLTKEQYLMKNVVQSFANKLYAQIVYLNK
jgi:DNA-binding transcriptional MerR regulator